MQTIPVDFQYSRVQLLMLKNWARVQTVNRGGRYEVDVEDDEVKITVWTTPQITEQEKIISTIIGTFSLILSEKNRITEIGIEEAYTITDLLHELAIQEQEALGRRMHGKRRSITSQEQ